MTRFGEFDKITSFSSAAMLSNEAEDPATLNGKAKDLLKTVLAAAGVDSRAAAELLVAYRASCAKGEMAPSWRGTVGKILSKHTLY